MENRKAAGVLIIDKDGLVLGFNRADGQGIALPCGKSEVDETPGQTAIRECFEETGMEVSLFGEPYVAIHKEFEVSCYRAKILSMGIPLHPTEGYSIWVAPNVVFGGVFGEYNRAAYEVLSKIPEK